MGRAGAGYDVLEGVAPASAICVADTSRFDQQHETACYSWWGS